MPDVPCPDCAEPIKPEARVCRHCGARFEAPRPRRVVSRRDSPAACCPRCDYDGAPRVERKVGTNGWIFFCVLLVVFFPLCWIPFVVDAFKEDVWTCGRCGARLYG